jgi:hypothetical protein
MLRTWSMALAFGAAIAGCKGNKEQQESPQERQAWLAQVAASIPKTPPETKEDLARIVFAALQLGDYSKLQPFYVQLGDLEPILAVAKVRDDKHLARLREHWPRAVQQVEKRSARYFENISRKAQEAGIDWRKAVLKKVDAREKDRRGLTQADIFLTIEFGGATYKVHIDDAQRSRRGWHLTFVSWQG